MRLLKENYEGLPEIKRLPQYLKDFLFLPNIKKLLEDYNFTVLYRASYNYLDMTQRHILTEVLCTLGIDPLIYLDYIPTYFLAYSKIKSINISSRIMSISQSAFERCSGLTSVTIPNSVTSIGNSAFEHCSSLTSIKYTGTKNQWSKIDLSFNWKEYSPIKTIHCIDGDITL